MTDPDPRDMERVIRDDGRYPPEAYGFLHEGLGKAVTSVHGDEAGQPGQHHVSGAELSRALRDLALERWGRLARTVLASWNIHKTDDFGNMVYLLIEHNFMRKTEEDSIEDFRDVFRFDDELVYRGSYELKD